jgi:carboxylesterase type B
MGGMAQTCAPAKDYQLLTSDVLHEAGVAPGDEAALLALDKSQLMKIHTSVAKRVFGNKYPGRYGRLGKEKVGFVGAATGTDFLPSPPLPSLSAGTANEVDLLLGTCADDGQLFSLVLPLPQALSARLFMNQLGGVIPNGDVGALIKYYRQQMRGRSISDVMKQANTDAFYRMPTIAAAEAHASRQPGRTYLYELDYQSAIDGLGAIHGIDCILLFGGSSGKTLIHRDAATEALRDQMRNAWVSFAKAGKPVANGMPEWKPFDNAERAVMVFDKKSRLMFNRDENLRQFWTHPAKP